MDYISPKDARSIERLREAAKEHGEVYDLLVVLSNAILIDGCGNKTLETASDADIQYIQVAQAAFSFCRVDRGEVIDDGAAD